MYPLITNICGINISESWTGAVEGEEIDYPKYLLQLNLLLKTFQGPNPRGRGAPATGLHRGASARLALLRLLSQPLRPDLGVLGHPAESLQLTVSSVP